METYAKGYIKTHRNCGGTVRAVENVTTNSPEFHLECLKCGSESLFEEQVEFRRRDD